MLSKTLIFLIMFTGIFGLFGALINGFASDVNTSLAPTYTNNVNEDIFTQAGLPTYGPIWEVNCTSFGGVLGTNASDIQQGHTLELQWLNAGGLLTPLEAFEIRDTFPGLLGLWTAYNKLSWYFKNGTIAKWYEPGGAYYTTELTRTMMGQAMNSTPGASWGISSFFAKGYGYSLSVLFMSNDVYKGAIGYVQNVTQAWDNRALIFLASYSYDTSANSFNVWNIASIVLGLSTINLGFPGALGTFLDTGLFLILWSVRSYLLIKLTLAIVPFIPGLQGD